MANNPFVSSNQIIDTDLGKKYEMLHQRAFTNLSVSTGWKPSDDGLFNYYNDINLTIQEGDEPITLAYSPFIIIAQNANPNCAPSNFPYARTVANNTVRLYAYRIPDPTDMLPITMTLLAVGSSEGTTNSGGSGGSGPGDIVIERTVLQVNGTSFLAPIGEDKLTTESVTIEMKMVAYQGEVKRKTTIGNIESVDLLFNSDGTAINIKDNNIVIKTLNGAVDDPNACVFWATIPKGVLLKDRLAYFVVPVTSGSNFFARSTLLTSRTDEIVNKITRYEISSPLISRSTTGVYYADGKVVGPTGIRFAARGYTTNGVSSDARGNLVFYNADTNRLIHRAALSSGSIDIIDPTIFNGTTNLKIVLEVEGKEVETKITEIATSVKDIIIQTESSYLVPIVTDSGLEIPYLDVRLFIQSTLNYIEPVFGRIVVKDDEGLTIAQSTGEVTSLRIPAKSYDTSTVPSYYKVEVFSPGESVAKNSKFISILSKGEITTPFYLDVTPSAVVILADKDGVIPSDTEHSFKARVLKGVNDVSSDWTLTSSIASGAATVVKVGDVFKITSMTSAAAVVTITAKMGSDTLTQQITLTKISQSGDSGNFTFVKYGYVESVVGDEKIYAFTVDPEGILPPGTIPGDFYGIVSTDVDEAPTDPQVYLWVPLAPDVDTGVQVPPMGSFAIEGEMIISAILGGDGSLSFYPQYGEYEIKALGELEPLVTHWQYKTNGVWIDFDNYRPEAGAVTIEYKNLPLSTNNSIAIRAKVETIVETELREFYAQSNIYILYNDKPMYFGQVRIVGGDSNYSHSFPIDRFGTAIDGTTYSKNPVYLTVDMYKGTNLLDMDTTKEEYFEVVNIRGSGAGLSYKILNNQLNATFDSIQGDSGIVYVSVKTSGGLEFDLPFTWTTRNTQTHIKSSIIATPSTTDFVINGVTLHEVENWSDAVANQKNVSDSLAENEPIEIRVEAINTGVESVSITNSIDQSLIKINPSLNYAKINKSGHVSPIGPIKGKNSSGEYYGDLIAGHYYLVVSKKITGKQELSLYNENLLSEVIEMPNNYNFGSDRAMVIKPVAGVNQFIYKDPSGFVPYIFKFAPVVELDEYTRLDSNFTGSLLDISKLPGAATLAPDVLPTAYQPISNVPYSYEIAPDGRGYMKLQPELAVYDPNFRNKFANDNITIRFDSSTGESTQISINRRVYPNKELGTIGKDLQSIFKGEYFDYGAISTIKSSNMLVKADREALIRLITELDVEAVEQEMPPSLVNTSFFYEGVQENSDIVYNVDTTEQIPALKGVDNETVFGFSLYDNSFYLMAFEVDGASAFTATFTLRNKANNEVIGTSLPHSITKRTKLEFIIPRSNTSTIPTSITDYIRSNGLSTSSSIPAPFMDRASVVGEFAPYYLHMSVSQNAPDVVKILNPQTWELRPELRVRSNIYSSIEGTQVYNEMIQKTAAFINSSDDLIDLYADTLTNGGESRILTSEYAFLMTQFKEAKDSIEDLKAEMDIVARKDSSESIFQMSTTNRSHIFGYTNSEGYMSSLEITPQGAVLKGDKHQIIGSTSIGALYGKKMVIGKDPTPEDIAYDKEYRINTQGREGILAVWDENERVWSSSTDKNGQFFMRYRREESSSSLIGYMVMNSKEIAAYDFPPIIDGLDGPVPIDVHSIQNKTSVFSIDDNGAVSINKLVINDAPTRKATVDLMGTVRITKYTSGDNKRQGIVFIGIGGN